tara:strand:- start:455 stop:583 length:129 start_codon:yes stop_codon:yes gene_type:complete
MEDMIIFFIIWILISCATLYCLTEGESRSHKDGGELLGTGYL